MYILKFIRKTTILFLLISNFNIYGLVWDFLANEERWTWLYHLTGQVINGIYILNISDYDPYMISEDNLNINSNACKNIRIRVKNLTSDTQAQIYWTTDVDNIFNEAKHIDFDIIPNDTVQREYIIDLSGNTNWTDTIKRIRIDPAKNVNEGIWELDYIKAGETEWYFTNWEEGWILTHNVTGFVSNSLFNLTITGSGPYIHSPDYIGIDTNEYKYIRIRMKNGTAGTGAQIYWITTTDNVWNSAKHIDFSVVADDIEQREYIIDLSGNTNWSGFVRQIRFDLPESNGTVDLDYIKIEKVSGVFSKKIYKITAKHSGKCLTVSKNSSNPGANIEQRSFLDREGQRWYLDDIGDNFYKFIAMNSNLVLDVYNALTENGTNIIQWNWWSGDCQKFKIDYIEPGYYRIIAKHSGKVIDVDSISQEEGANIHQWEWAGTDNQRWAFSEEIPTPTPTFTDDIARFNFEDGTLQGWYLNTENGIKGVTLTVSSDFAFGLKSIKLEVNFTGNELTWNQAAIAIDNQIPSGIINAKIYLPSYAPEEIFAKLFLQDAEWQWKETSLISLNISEWNEINWDLSAISFKNPVNRLGIAIGSNTNYNKYVYIDSINFIDATFTSTDTPSITPTITQTITTTITQTITKTATQTVTETITNTASPTITPSITETMTPTITNTPIYANIVLVSNYDLMPITVSTGQKDVYAVMYTLKNPSQGEVLIKGITLTVKDANENYLSADKAINTIGLRDEFLYYYISSTITTSSFIYCPLSSGIYIGPASEKNIYVVVEITGNTLNRASEFKISIDSPFYIRAEDFLNGNTLPVTSDFGFLFPLDSSLALIQNNAKELSVTVTDMMPESVSTDQNNVKAMQIDFENIGDTLTASIKVSRLTFNILDSNGNSIPGNSVIKKIKITNSNGDFIYGDASAGMDSKITIILSAPLIVPSTQKFSSAILFDVQNSIIFSSMKIAIVMTGDIYAVDANSNAPVIITSFTPFPKMTSPTLIQEKVSSINLDNFVSLQPLGVVKGQKWVELFSFRIYDTLSPQSAVAQFKAMTITVKNTAGNAIAANSVIDKLYITDNAGNTLGSAVAGVGDKVRIELNTPYNFISGQSQYFKIYADILTTAYAPNFKVGITGDNDISVIDKNSGYEAEKIETPDFPWETTGAGVYTAPATDLWVWHNGNIAPTMAGMGQPDVKFMLISFFNPGHLGTADIMISGVTLTTIDDTNNIIAPLNLLESIYITNTIGDVTYAYYNTVSNTVGAPFYLQFTKPFFIEAQNTKTAYISGNINLNAVEGTYKIRINSEADMERKSLPVGYVTITAVNNDNFPFDSNPVTITALAYNFKVGHKNLMPISVVKGQENVNVLLLNFENYNAIPIAVTSIAFTVKNCKGENIFSDDLINKAKLLDKDNNLIAELNNPTGTKLFFNNFEFRINQGTEKNLKLVIDIKKEANTPFYVELEKSQDITTLPKASINPAEGYYFGNMKSNCVSIQNPFLKDSFHIFPNPVVPVKSPAYIEYYLENESEVTIQIFTINGRLVKKIIENKIKEKGLHYEDIWDCKNQGGFDVRSGVYLAVIEVKDKKTNELSKLIYKFVVIR